MTTATEIKLQYRKTRKGEWVVYGPHNALTFDNGRGGRWTESHVTVTKRDGTTKTEALLRVGKPFTVDGVEMAYGYIDRRTNSHRVAASGRCGDCRRELAAWEIRDYGTVCHDCF